MLPEYSLPVGGTQVRDPPMRYTASMGGWGQWGQGPAGLASQGTGGARAWRVRAGKGPPSALLEPLSLHHLGNALSVRFWRYSPDKLSLRETPGGRHCYYTHFPDEEREAWGSAGAHTAGGFGGVWKLCCDSRCPGSNQFYLPGPSVKRPF